jgi:hypothetical protein
MGCGLTDDIGDTEMENHAPFFPQHPPIFPMTAPPNTSLKKQIPSSQVNQWFKDEHGNEMAT